MGAGRVEASRRKKLKQFLKFLKALIHEAMDGCASHPGNTGRTPGPELILI